MRLRCAGRRWRRRAARRLPPAEPRVPRHAKRQRSRAACRDDFPRAPRTPGVRRSPDAPCSDRRPAGCRRASRCLPDTGRPPRRAGAPVRATGPGNRAVPGDPGWTLQTTRALARPVAPSGNEAASQAANGQRSGEPLRVRRRRIPRRAGTGRTTATMSRRLHRRGGEPVTQRRDERHYGGRRQAAGVDRVRAKSGPDERPGERGAVAQGLRAQAARTPLVVRIRVDEAVDGPRAVNGHGMLLPANQAGQSIPTMRSIPNRSAHATLLLTGT